MTLRPGSPLRLLLGLGLAVCAPGSALAQSEAAPAEDSAPGEGPIGRVFDINRRAIVPSLEDAARGLLDDEYLAFKARVAKDHGLSWTMDVSWLQQWGARGGGSPAAQWLAIPQFNWVLFDSKDIGAGSVQLVYNAARYGTAQDATAIQERLDLVTPINDYAHRQDIFPQLSYTHAFPGTSLIVGVGQFPIYNFDDSDYLNNQQRNFNNYILSQNGSATYPQGGVGAWAQIDAAPTVQLAGGFQNATNVGAQTLSAKGIGQYGVAWFGYAQWTPAFAGKGSAQYSLLYYQAPSVPAQPRTRGWSLNAVQNLDDTWAVFGRANRAYEFVTPIRASYAIGVAMNNPLGRSVGDQVALAFGYSDVAPPPVNPPGTRNEKILEAYWNWSVTKVLLVTPDVQYIIDPALSPTRNRAWIWSLRTTFRF